MSAWPPFAPRQNVTPVAYAPPAGYALDVEIYPAGELRRRAGDVAQRGFERIDFHCLLLVTAGPYVHLVDFESLPCPPGTLLVLQPGQVHHFGDLTQLEGWLAILRADLLAPSGAGAPYARASLPLQILEALPSRIRLQPAAQSALIQNLERLAQDAAGSANETRNALMRAEVEALVLRLQLDHAALEPPPSAQTSALQRFRRFRTLVELEFRREHGASHYAACLGCSERSLARAALSATGRSAKEVVTARVMLEAKRLLVHSRLSVESIGHEIGFSEATNFVKAFRRETRLSPGAFRAQFTRRNPEP